MLILKEGLDRHLLGPEGGLICSAAISSRMFSMQQLKIPITGSKALVHHVNTILKPSKYNIPYYRAVSISVPDRCKDGTSVDPGIGIFNRRH